MDLRHIEKVKHLQGQVADYYARSVPFRVYHGSTNSTRILSFKRSEMVDISALNSVISVDIENRTAIVEPNLPMDTLVRETLKFGLVPPVVMEFPGITVGGGIQGGAGESGSFRWGCFNRIFNWYEMVLANGEVMRVSPENHADLFDGTAGSYGSLGIITAAEIQLVPAAKYVNLTYLLVTSFDEAVETLKTESAGDHDFIDGIMFGSDHGLIVVGSLSDRPTGRPHRFSRAHDEWFYLHAEAIDRAGETVMESVPLVDYLFRYDRGAFWVGRFAFERFGVPYNRFFRWLLNPILHTRQLYQALQDSGASQEHVVQDLALPLDRAAEFMQYIHQSMGVYPLWLCPLEPDSKSQLQSNNLDTPLVINVGVWGTRIESYNVFMTANRSIEQKLQELGGKKWFYAHSYYPEVEFWDIYDKGWYDALRKKYHATSLPSVFEKTQVHERYEVDARRGALRTLFGLAKLRIKD